ncbi:MAG: tRNA threonylcarbamoyladenosine dehydratase [Bacteroidota bacterium]
MSHPEWLSRSELLLGNNGLDKLKAAHVLVIGLGGVGGAAAEMLCRAGIGQLTLVDKDTIHESNRNRQLPALISTDGFRKTDVVAQRLRDINPEVQLTLICEDARDERMIEILSQPYDYVVDAIDTLSPKIYLIYHGLQLGRRIVSSMGSGGRTDPTMVSVADISETHTCAFAFDIRKRLRRLGVENGVKVVFSPEKVSKSAILHHEGEKNKKSIVGTVSYMPVVFGCHCASVVIRDIAEL